VLIKCRLLLAAAATVVSFNADAGPTTTGNQWMEVCSIQTTLGASLCVTYTTGLRDGLDLWKIIAPASALVCVPQAVSLVTTIEP
jgi:hypothetical protein